MEIIFYYLLTFYWEGTYYGSNHIENKWVRILTDLNFYFQISILVLIIFPIWFLNWLGLKWDYHFLGSYIKIKREHWAKQLFNITLKIKGVIDYEQEWDKAFQMHFESWKALHGDDFWLLIDSRHRIETDYLGLCFLVYVTFKHLKCVLSKLR